MTDPEMANMILPLRTVSLTNQRTHWAVKARRARAERITVATLWTGRTLKAGEIAGIWLCRVAPRRLDDDNLRAALKSIRDRVAEELGVDDGSERLIWMYEQRRGKPKEYAVLVEVRYSDAARSMLHAPVQAEAARPRGDKA